jgi:uncharacterized membrane protein
MWQNDSKQQHFAIILLPYLAVLGIMYASWGDTKWQSNGIWLLFASILTAQ